MPLRGCTRHTVTLNQARGMTDAYFRGLHHGVALLPGAPPAPTVGEARPLYESPRAMASSRGHLPRDNFYSLVCRRLVSTAHRMGPGRAVRAIRIFHFSGMRMASREATVFPHLPGLPPVRCGGVVRSGFEMA